jgi:hypothetical protein
LEADFLLAKEIGVSLVVICLLIIIFIVIDPPLHIIGSGFGIKHIMGTITGTVVFISGLIMSLFVKPKKLRV